MNKVLYQGDQEDLLSLCHGEMSRLVDLSKVTKQAASSCFPDLSDYKPDDDHFMVHAVALGATPRYLPNRNADSMSVEDLKNNHDTFVKNGHFFREHRNRDPKQAIGVIKASAYNEDLDRVELIIHGDKRKAEPEYELAKSGKELSFSMSANMKHDVCSCCGHKSRSLAEHCDHIKKSANQYLPEFRKYAFMHNPNPKFFDMSAVNRPADRIAHYLEYAFPDADSMQKAASSDTLVIPGEKWAEFEGVELPEEEEPSVYDATINKLAEAEEWYNHQARINYDKSPRSMFVQHVVKNAFVGEGKEEVPEVMEELQPGILLRKLADHKVVLPFPAFTSYVTGKTISELEKEEDYVKSASQLPHLFTNLTKSAFDMQEIEELVSQFLPAQTTQNCVRKEDEVDQILETMGEKFSCDIAPMNARTTVIIIKSGSTKPSEPKENDTDGTLGKYASVYAAYQTALTSFIGEDELFEYAMIGRNRFSS